MKCDRKKRYDKRGAITVKNFAKKQGRPNLRAYPCPYCKYWHLTKQKYTPKK